LRYVFLGRGFDNLKGQLLFGTDSASTCPTQQVKREKIGAFFRKIELQTYRIRLGILLPIADCKQRLE
jgi:hypothetical protein